MAESNSDQGFQGVTLPTDHSTPFQDLTSPHDCSHLAKHALWMAKERLQPTVLSILLASDGAFRLVVGRAHAALLAT